MSRKFSDGWMDDAEQDISRKMTVGKKLLIIFHKRVCEREGDREKK